VDGCRDLMSQALDKPKLSVIISISNDAVTRRAEGDCDPYNNIGVSRTKMAGES